MGIVRIPVTVTNNLPGGPFMNVLHVRTVGGGDDDAVDVGHALDALVSFYTSIRTLYPNGSVIKMGEGMILDPLGSPTYFPDDSRTVTTGAVAGGTTSTLLSIVVSWRTMSASRSGRGRTFIGPLNGDAITTDGTPADSAVNMIRNAAAALVEDSDSLNGWALGVLSTKEGILRDVTGSSVRDRWSFLSSRRD